MKPTLKGKEKILDGFRILETNRKGEIVKDSLKRQIKKYETKK